MYYFRNHYCIAINNYSKLEWESYQGEISAWHIEKYMICVKVYADSWDYLDIYSSLQLYSYSRLGIQKSTEEHHVWLRGLKCKGDEKSIEECDKASWGSPGLDDCSLVSVVCYKSGENNVYNFSVIILWFYFVLKLFIKICMVQNQHVFYLHTKNCLFAQSW